MGSVLKGNRYRLVDNRSFELPLPVKYELLKEDSTIAEYEISDKEQVTCRIITKHKEEMLTPIQRPLDISDIYYFFSCRVFQDKTPFTLTELSLLGLEKYNVYDIIRKTRGVTPFDTYWLRFDGDNCDYETAKTTWDNLMSRVGAPVDNTVKSEPAAPKSDADVNEILHQHKVDVAAKFAAQTEPAQAPVLQEPEPVANNTMSAEEIEALLLKSGLTDLAADNDEPEKPAPAEEKSSGGMMSQEAIEAMLAATSAPAEPEPTLVEEKSSGGMMSQEAIEAMLAATSAPAESEPAPEPTLVEEKPASGGKMSQDDIEKMLAAASAPAEPEPAPVEEKPASGGKMSQDDIEKMLAAANAPAEPEPEPAPEPAPVEEKPASGGKMSQDDIEKMLAAASAPAEPEPAPEPAPVEEKPASGGKMSQEDIEKMLAAASAPADPEPEPAPEPAPVEEKPASGGKMSQEDIEKMLAAANAPAEPEPEPSPVEEKPASGGKMSQDDIEKMLAAASGAVENAVSEPSPEPEQPTLDEPAPAEEKPASSGKMSQADIEALLNGMKEDAAT